MLLLKSQDLLFTVDVVLFHGEMKVELSLPNSKFSPHLHNQIVIYGMKNTCDLSHFRHEKLDF